ncbi:tnsC [Symbiodinium microadriaticum]|nr:tnsC [Symbiodinium microadriaticum]
MVEAVYRDTGVPKYQGNPLIEALPPILAKNQLKAGLSRKIERPGADKYADGQTRIHIVSQLMDDYFQPLARHAELETKLSVMLREGYVGRNLANGDLNSHIQNSYERIMQGDVNAVRFDHVESTAKSLSFIGCSGSGKTSSINRILQNYPQLIFHKEQNFIQIVFLKVDCPHDGSLKNLCHNFFREIDAVLGTAYVRKYLEKRHSVDRLIAIMAHIANTHAIGLLVIDEIQHLSARRSGGAELMLNFFVTLVNKVSIPVVMVGTPKARSVFEADLRSARRGAGFGALLWEPLERPDSDKEMSRTEWGAFTNQLWRYQWLTKAEPVIPEDVRETWYDLSQGILDVVIKLFVLSQIRAIATGIERVTAALMRKVYQDELKPIHPMIEALQSGDTTRIAQYSDLTVPDVDRKILEFQQLLQTKAQELDIASKYRGNDQAIRLHNMLVSMDLESDLLEPLIDRAFKDHPNLKMPELIPLIMDWYKNAEMGKPARPRRKVKTVKQKDWQTLDPDDLRFLFSQAAKPEELVGVMDRDELIYSVVARAGVRLGEVSPKQLLDEVFGSRTVVDDLLNLDVLQSPSFAQWTRYYQTLVDRHGLRRGAKQVDHRLVRDLVLKTWPAAWLENHHLLPDASSKDGADWLHGIFRKHRKSFGYLEHIVVNQALLGDHWHIKDAISEALQYPAKSKRKVVSIELQSNPEVTPDQQAWMMLLEELPPKRARETSPALYSRLYRKNRLWLLSENRRHAAKNVGGGARKVDWDQRDRECFDRLKRVSASLKAKNSGRRRTPAAYLQEMENKATVEKNLFRMPLSKSYLTSEAESVAAFQIRRLKCAYRNLESEVAQPPRWRLLRTANLSDERLTAEADKFLTSLLEDQNELQGR